MRRTLFLKAPGEGQFTVEAASGAPGDRLDIRIRGFDGTAVANGIPGGFLIRRGRRALETGITRTRSGELEVRIGLETFRISTGRTRRARGDGAGGGEPDGAVVRTSMPGKVVRILRGNGEAVEAGESVLVFEAMKMQNEIPAPTGGVVAKLRAQPGALLEGGEFLFEVEAVPPR